MNIPVTSDVIKTILQSSVGITVLFFLVKIMGKKHISRLTYFDYVVGISIGSLAANIILKDTSDFLLGIISMIVITCFPIILSYISMKSFSARKFFDGSPIIIIQNGKIIEKNLKRSKLNINDVLILLRIKNVFNITDVEFAILETNGKISIQLKANKQPTKPSDLNINVKYEGLCTNLIIDGNVINSNLNFINKDIGWLINELKKQNINSISEVLLASLDNTGNLHIDKKNNDPTLIKL